jgi:hypothetical protein
MRKATTPMTILNSCCRSRCTALSRYGSNLCCFVALGAPVTDKHFLCPGHFLATTCAATCFTNSIRQFRCDIIFRSEHTLCSWIHHVPKLLSKWREHRPSNEGDPVSSATREVRRAYYTRMGQLLISFLYSSTLLLFDCVLNGPLYVFN